MRLRISAVQPDAQSFATHHASSVLHNLFLQPDAQFFATQHAPSVLHNLTLHNDAADSEAALEQPQPEPELEPEAALEQLQPKFGKLFSEMGVFWECAIAPRIVCATASAPR